MNTFGDAYFENGGAKYTQAPTTISASNMNTYSRSQLSYFHTPLSYFPIHSGIILTFERVGQLI
jgi:hypothetical protein